MVDLTIHLGFLFSGCSEGDQTLEFPRHLLPKLTLSVQKVRRLDFWLAVAKYIVREVSWYL
jgi:hypothetical protein